MRLVLWTLVAAAVVLATRAVVYALVPSQSVLLEELSRQEGGPHLAGVLAAVLLVAAAVAVAALWLAVVAVRERIELEGRKLVEAPRLRLWRLARRVVLLFAAASFAFALLESYLHWRAGLGWHGAQCLVGPVHRDAIPILAAFSLVAVAVSGAIEHLVAWARRLFAQLAACLPRLRGIATGRRLKILPRSRSTGSAAVARGPPGGFAPALSF